MSKHVLVVYGGDNSEREVSLASGQEAGKALVEAGYKVSYLDTKKDNFVGAIQGARPDVVFNALHGSFGEDGSLPAILESQNIPYTHSGVKASALAWDKSLAKVIASSVGMDVPKSVVFMAGHDPSLDMLRIMDKPFVIKPVSEGSSCNMQIVLQPETFTLGNLNALPKGRYLIEEYIKGREVTVAILMGEVIGATEIVTREEYYDYHAKYKSHDNQYITPPDIETKLLAEIYGKSAELHEVMGCLQVSRSDFIFSNGKFYFLELNTHPGLTVNSLVPKIACKRGISMVKLVADLVEEALQ